MGKRSKRIKTVTINPLTSSNERYNFEELPLDLEIEILKRLPVKSLGRFLLVSKLWATIIRSRDFITSFPFGSSSKPRILVTFIHLDRRRRRQNWHFFSSASTSTSFLSCPFPNPEHVEEYSYYVNGLMSIGHGQKQIICNPSTGKSIILPKVKTRRKVVFSYFGYDQLNDQYKVLCMTKLMNDQTKPSSEHQVLTIGAEKKSWRMINCSIPHSPWRNGVCIDGVVYYVAFTGEGLSQQSLMRFELRSEKLDLFTSLPEHIPAPTLFNVYTLINYKGKVAIPTKTSPYTFAVWVMETHGWLKKCFSIGPWKDLFQGCGILLFTGTTNTGEFILAPRYYSDEFCVIYYDPDTNSIRNIKVEVNGDYEFKSSNTTAIVFSDYLESVRLL